jgi:hypothetical protein
MDFLSSLGERLAGAARSVLAAPQTERTRQLEHVLARELLDLVAEAVGRQRDVRALRPEGGAEPELFLYKSYDEKTTMIRDLMQPITVEMVVQEINRYADSEFRYADKSDEVAIDALVRDMGRMDEAKRRYVGGKG